MLNKSGRNGQFATTYFKYHGIVLKLSFINTFNSYPCQRYIECFEAFVWIHVLQVPGLSSGLRYDLSDAII